MVTLCVKLAAQDIVGGTLCQEQLQEGDDPADPQLLEDGTGHGPEQNHQAK